MKSRKVTNIDDLARKLGEYELVLTAEASMADALNKRFEEEQAFTPRRLAFEGEEDFRRQLFLDIVDETGMPWKQASYLMNRCLECWKQTGSPDITGYAGFDNEYAEKVVEYVKDFETPFKAVENYSIETDNLAAVNVWQFDAVDRTLIDNAECFDTITEDKTELEEFKIFESGTQLVQSLVENVDRINSENCAVAVNPDSQYQPLIESSFEAQGINYVAEQRFSQRDTFRGFLSVLRAGLASRDARIEDVKPVLDMLGVRYSPRDRKKFLSSIDGLEEFKEFLNVLQYLEFGEALEKFEGFTGNKVAGMGTIIESLGLENKNLSQSGLERIEHFVENYEPKKTVNEGVLLVNPKNTGFVDRDYVFFIGMDSSWTREVDSSEWADVERMEEKNRNEFLSVIQSGRNQVYMVQDREMNEAIHPCFHFNEILGEEFTEFTDLPHTHCEPEGLMADSGFEKENTGVDENELSKISQSSLNTFALSPRLYYFSRLVSDAEEEHMRKGNLFHDYAEFYVNYPKFVENTGNEKFLEIMIENIRPFAEDLNLERLETEFRVGTRKIREFLKPREVESHGIDAYGPTDGDNIFAELFDRPVDSENTEVWFDDEDLGVKGKVDLVMSKTHLVDYKSGRSKTAENIVKGSRPGTYNEARYPNFQALMYLAHHRKHVPDEQLKFTFLYFLDGLGETISGDDSSKAVTVKYYPETFGDAAASMQTYEKLIKNVAKSNDRRKTLEKLGYTAYSQFMSENEVPEVYDNSIVETEFGQEFIGYAKSEVGEYKYVSKGCKSALKKLVEFRNKNYFKEDLDRFDDFMDEQLDKLNTYKNDRFPIGERNPEDLPERDMILR